MFTKENAIKIIRDFILDCKSSNIILRRAILFGSIAKNSKVEDSDIDLAIVSDNFSYDQFENAMIIAPISINYSDIDAHTFPTEYFEKGDPFIEEILRTGIEIEIN